MPFVRVQQIPTTQYFENYMFLNLLPDTVEDWESHDYVGIISWKTKQKIRLPNVTSVVQNANANDADVIAFMMPACREHQHLNGWVEQCHPHVKYLWSILCEQLGYTPEQYLSTQIPAFCCNYWMAKPEWLKRYMQHIRKARDILESYDTDDGEFQRKLHENSGHTFRVPPVGIHYVMYHSFLLERLPCLFFWVNKANVYFPSI